VVYNKARLLRGVGDKCEGLGSKEVKWEGESTSKSLLISEKSGKEKGKKGKKKGKGKEGKGKEI